MKTTDQNFIEMCAKIADLTDSKVNRYTRAGRDGKIISCPVCGYKKIVYHFGWCAITCTGCKKDIEKTQWNLF